MPLLCLNLLLSAHKSVCEKGGRSEVGIDIEQVRSDIYSIDMEQLCLSREERIALETLSFVERMQTFYSLWTYKEAVVKGLGCGLEYPLTGLEIDISHELNPKIKSQNLNDWNLHPLRCPQNFKGALAIKRQNVRLTFKELKSII